MSEQSFENLNSFYTTALLPLTEEDKQVIKKAIKPYYQANALLIPLLVLVYFFGLLYFLAFLAFVISYNIFAFSSIEKNELSLNHPKIILTGKITKKEPPGDGLIVYLGPERFDLTYANITFPVEPGDMVALHYSQFNLKQRGIILSVKKELPVRFSI